MFNIQNLIDPLIPHFVSTRDVAVHCASSIIERLDEIRDAVENPQVIEERKAIPFSLAQNGSMTITVPVGETWEIENFTAMNTGAGASTARYRLYDGDVASGLLIFGTSASADMPASMGGNNIRVPGGSQLTLIYDFGVVPCVGRIGFVIRRAKPKIKGRFSGLFEREIDYEYAYAQDGLSERHFATVSQPNNVDIHNGHAGT